MQASQLIALLLPEGWEMSQPQRMDEYVARGATALIRDAEGRISIEPVTHGAAFREQILTTGCFRRGKPIIDPATRQVMGYEMEMVAAHDPRPQLAF
jgi:hypothetical protein